MKLPMPVLIGAAAGVLIVFAGLIFLVARKGRKNTLVQMAHEPAALPAGGEKPALQAVDMEAQIEAQLAEREEEQRKADLATLAAIKVPPVKTKKAEVLAKQIRETTKKDSISSANILQSWIHER